MSLGDLQFGIRRRVIIDTDAKNEADDQYAIVHALLSPSLDIRGLVAAHFGFRRGFASMQESRAEIDLVLSLMDINEGVRVENGAATPLYDSGTPVDSPGAQLIIEEALRDEAGPLFVAFLGPLTDMATALLLAPEIVERDVTVVWIGGGPYEGFGADRPGRPEFNLGNDIPAANLVFASGVKLWQIPSSSYRLMGVSYAELYKEVYGCGRIGKYLVDQLVEFNEAHPHEGYHQEYRSLGDSPAVGLILNPQCGWWSERPAWQFRTDGSYDRSREFRPIRVYNYVDPRFILGDFFAKLQGAWPPDGRR